MSTDSLITQLKHALPSGSVEGKVPLSEHCSFRVGGPADLFIRVKTQEELARTIALLREAKEPFFVLGRGTNLLIGDGGYRGAIVTMCPGQGDEGHFLSDIEVEGNRIRAGAGASLHSVAAAAARASLTGLEFAAGIPGTIGGGIVMNAGAYGGEMKQVVREVCLLDLTDGGASRESADGGTSRESADGGAFRESADSGAFRVYSGEEMRFGYRTSRVKEEPSVVTRVTMELTPGNTEEILARMDDLAKQRRDKQPLEFPSAGSTFKRPEGYFAGKLIEDAGLKGLRRGDAEVSAKHSGFIINRGNATAAQIRQLIEEVQQKVYEDSGVLLEREVIYLGEF